ncbi:MAG TPA: STAS domain-containing protein [Permianibacter sp.]|nr:STAS domain-containing protein [Permianibacter sp.]
MMVGQASYAIQDGIYILKFRGDIRFHLCASVDRFIQRIFQETVKPKVIIDLLEATAVDSTALGVIAQIAIHTRRAYDHRPTILVRNPDLLAVLNAVSFNKVFHILPDAEHEPESYRELESEPADEIQFTRQALLAHRHLMALSHENRMLFQDVTRALESVAHLH